MSGKVYEISHKIIDILKRDINSSEYFQNEIDWIEKRIDSWNRNIIRIGLLGITSSGKSTLVNALLGYNLLPGRVIPTSGVIVGCMKGNKFNVTINYNDGKTENIEKYKIARKKLSVIADEQKNPNNIFDVNQIEIKSPNFIPNINDLKILDSPGLNACNLETHEKITYEVLLGDIDICIFLTSLKPNADKDDKEILVKIDDSNKEYNKQVIIVQNKLDSVLPKPGRRIGIAKSKEQVAKEYGERIKRLCSDLKMKPRFCQISSKYALSGRISNNNEKIKSSQINIFLDILKESIENEKLHRESKRLNQISRKIFEINKTIDEKTNIIKHEYTKINKWQDEFDNLKNIYEKSISEFTELEKNIKNLYRIWDSEISERYKKIGIIDPYNLKSAENIINEIISITESTRNEVLHKIKIFKKILNELIEQFNLIPEDLDISDIFLEKETIDEIDISVTKEAEINCKYIGTQKVKKIGKWNAFKRFISLGNWGYEIKDEYKTEYTSKDKINVFATMQNIISLTEKIKSKDKSGLDKIHNKFRNQMEEINKELKIKENNINFKRREFISPDILKLIMSDLNNILNSSDLKRLELNDDQSVISENKNNVNPENKIFISSDIPNYIYSIYRLSELKTLFLFENIWNAVLRNYTNDKNVILFIGWDYTPIIDFANRFIYCNKINEDLFSTTGYQEEIINNRNVIYINRNIYNDDEIMMSVLNKYNDKKFDIFTFLNISSFGHTEKIFNNDTLYNSMIKDKNNRSNWIYTDFQSDFSNDDIEWENIEEAVKLFIEFPYKKTGNKNCNYIVNSPNPVYSLMFYEYRNVKSESDSLKVQSNILNNININPYLNSNIKKLSKIICKTFLEFNSNYNGKQINNSRNR